VVVDRHNALYDLLMFPLVHEKGVGGYFYARDGSCVQSSTGVKLSLQMYTRAMLFQNERLHYLGRLAQEYALVQHSRQVEDTLSFQLPALWRAAGQLKRRRDMNSKVGQQGAGSRVALIASVVTHAMGAGRLLASHQRPEAAEAPAAPRRPRAAKPRGSKTNTNVYICSA
jgi:hypothetical protein